MRAVGHYEVAELLIDMAGEDDQGSTAERYHLDLAQVHATLALAGATALQSYARTDDSDDELLAWELAAGGES